MKTHEVTPSKNIVYWCNEFNSTCLVHGFSALDKDTVFIELLSDTMEPQDENRFQICNTDQLTILGGMGELSEIFVFQIDTSDYPSAKPFVATLCEVLIEINGDRNPEWNAYNKHDWKEGLSEWSEWVLIK